MEVCRLHMLINGFNAGTPITGPWFPHAIEHLTLRNPSETHTNQMFGIEESQSASANFNPTTVRATVLQVIGLKWNTELTVHKIQWFVSNDEKNVWNDLWKQMSLCSMSDVMGTTLKPVWQAVAPFILCVWSSWVCPTYPSLHMETLGCQMRKKDTYGSWQKTLASSKDEVWQTDFSMLLQTFFPFLVFYIQPCLNPRILIGVEVHAAATHSQPLS